MQRLGGRVEGGFRALVKRRDCGSVGYTTTEGQVWVCKGSRPPGLIVIFSTRTYLFSSARSSVGSLMMIPSVGGKRRSVESGQSKVLSSTRISWIASPVLLSFTLRGPASDQLTLPSEYPIRTPGHTWVWAGSLVCAGTVASRTRTRSFSKATLWLPGAAISASWASGFTCPQVAALSAAGARSAAQVISKRAKRFFTIDLAASITETGTASRRPMGCPVSVVPFREIVLCAQRH